MYVNGAPNSETLHLPFETCPGSSTLEPSESSNRAICTGTLRADSHLNLNNLVTALEPLVTSWAICTGAFQNLIS